MDHMMFEVGTALILVAIASVIAGKLKFSIIPFLIVLGMLVGPHAPTIGILDFKFIESQGSSIFWDRSVFYSCSLPWSRIFGSKLIKSGRNIVVGGTVYVVLNFVLGVAYGFVINMPLYETLIIAGCCRFPPAPSSLRCLWICGARGMRRRNSYSA